MTVPDTAKKEITSKLRTRSASPEFHFPPLPPSPILEVKEDVKIIESKHPTNTLRTERKHSDKTKLNKTPPTKNKVSKIPEIEQKSCARQLDNYTSEQYQKRFDELWSQCQKSESSSRRESRGRRRGLNEEICPKCHHVKGKRRRSKSSDNYLKQSSKGTCIEKYFYFPPILYITKLIYIDKKMFMMNK